MAETLLYLDGEIVDLDPSTVIVENKQINSLFELKDRQTSYTNSFKILLNKRTNAIFDRIGDYYSASNKPYEKLTAYVTRNGVPTIINGTFTIDTIQGREYMKGNVQSGVVSLFEGMGTKSVSQLDLSLVDHQFSTQNVISSYVHTWVDGYIYPLADYGILDVNEIDTRYQQPALFMKYIWEEIFIQNGFTYTYVGSNNPLESDNFKNKVLSLGKGLIYDDVANTGVILDINQSAAVNQIYYYNQYINFNEVTDTENLHSGGVISVSQSGTYNFNLSGINHSGGIGIVKNGAEVYYNTGVFTDNVNISIATSDTVRFFYRRTQNDNLDRDWSLTVTASRNTALNFSSLYNTLKQSDFFKSVLQMYGLTFQKDDHTNNFRFISYEDLLKDRQGSQDFSLKYNRLLTRTYKFGSFGKYNTATYNYENDDDTFADGSFEINNQTLPTTVNVLKSPYKAIELTDVDITLNDTHDIYSAPLFEVELNDDTSLKNIKEKTSKHYIININKQSGFNVKFTDGTSSILYAGNIALANFEELHMQRILENYYEKFIEVKNNTKVYSMELKLTALDVAKFDFLKLVYMAQFQAYFYVNKIINYRENKVTKVELIEV